MIVIFAASTSTLIYSAQSYHSLNVSWRLVEKLNNDLGLELCITRASYRTNKANHNTAPR